MAIAYNSLLTSNYNSANNFTTASVTPTAGNITFLMFIARNNTATTPTVSGCNLTWTKITPTGTPPAIFQLWYGVGNSPTSGTISVTGEVSCNTNLWAVFDFTGVDTSAPIIQSAYAAASSVTLASAFQTGSAAIGMGYRTSTGTLPAGGGFTQLVIVDNGGRAMAVEYQLLKTDDTIVDMTNAGEIVGLELKVATSAASTGNWFLMF